MEQIPTYPFPSTLRTTRDCEQPSQTYKEQTALDQHDCFPWGVNNLCGSWSWWRGSTGRTFFVLVEPLTKSPCSQTGWRWAGCVNCRVDEKLAEQIRIKANSSKSNRQPIWGTVSQELVLRLMNQLDGSMNLCQRCEWLLRTNLQYINKLQVSKHLNSWGQSYYSEREMEKGPS